MTTEDTIHLWLNRNSVVFQRLAHWMPRILELLVSAEAESTHPDLRRALRTVFGGACPGCDACQGDGPPHFASPECESGGRNHCSCDTCF